MDKVKGLTKGGWHPAGDKQISRENWKSDLKGIATGKKKDPYEEQRNHQSTPLASLRDPDSFGPPPRHHTAEGFARVGTASSSISSPAAPPERLTGGWGSSAVDTGYAQRKKEREEAQRLQAEQEAKAASAAAGPYRTDTTGLRTDNLPKPPVRRETPGSTQSPTLPPRVPPRQTAGGTSPAPPPSLPPRQNEYPDEHTPAPPPPYHESLGARQPQAQLQDQLQGQVNQAAANRLGRAGISVPGFGIGGSGGNTSNSGSQAQNAAVGQVSELQQRFAKMKTGTTDHSESSVTSSSSAMAAAAHKKPPPPPPPPKKGSLAVSNVEQQVPPAVTSESAPGHITAPPPVPTSSKPKP